MRSNEMQRKSVGNIRVPVSVSGIGGLLRGVVVFMGLVMALLYFGIPAIRLMGPAQVDLPSTPVVKADVNMTQK